MIRTKYFDATVLVTSELFEVQRVYTKSGDDATDLIDELAKRDHDALALGHANRLAISEQVHELAEQDLEFAGISQRVADVGDALDVAVMVAAPDVDHVVHALELVPVIGDV